jgi:nucleoside-diphosphate-sugar epimerase
MRHPLPLEDLDRVIEMTAEVWSSMAGARVFVTGGTGFIGAWMLEAIQRANLCAHADIDVVVLSRAPQRAIELAPHLFGSDSRISLIAGDVTSFESNPGAIDICIHAATDVGDPAKAGDHLRIFDAGVLGTRHVLDVAIANGASRFLLTSSGAVYGTQPPGLDRLCETYAGAPNTLDPRTAYGQGKRAAEWLATRYASISGLSVVIARIFALIGPGMPLDGSFAAGNFVRDGLKGGNITVKNGRPIRSYLYAADACIWLLRMLDRGANGVAYNLGSEQALSVADLASLVAVACNCEVDVEASIVESAELPPRYVPDTRKAYSELGLKEYTSFDVALAKTIEWSRGAVML